MRPARLVLLPVAGAALTFGAAASAAGRAEGPASAPPTTVAPAAPTSTTEAVVTGPSDAPPASVTQAGSSIGGLDKSADEGSWSARRLATTTAITVVALALAGYVYGRVASAAS